MKITELLAEVDQWTSLGDRFLHLRTQVCQARIFLIEASMLSQNKTTVQTYRSSDLQHSLSPLLKSGIAALEGSARQNKSGWGMSNCGLAIVTLLIR